MQEESFITTFKGREYIWDGADWYDSKTFAIPPTQIIGELNRIRALQSTGKVVELPVISRDTAAAA